MSPRHRPLVLLAALAMTVSAISRASDVPVLYAKRLDNVRLCAEGLSRPSAQSQNADVRIVLMPLDGSSNDSATLKRLQTAAPKVVVALGSYACRQARQTLPSAWIVYAQVPYPEVDGLTKDPRMTGVSEFGAEKLLYEGVRPWLSKGKLGVIYSEVIAESLEPIMKRLREAGFDAEALPVSQAPLLTDLFARIQGRYAAVLLLPDPLTSNPDALRFLVTRCVETGVLPLAADISLVAQGALYGASPSMEQVNRMVLRVVGEALAGAPAGAPVRYASGSTTALNLGTLSAASLPRVPADQVY